MDHRPWNLRGGEVGYLVAEAKCEVDKAAELLRSALRRCTSKAQKAQLAELVSTATLLVRQCERASKADIS